MIPVRCRSLQPIYLLVTVFVSMVLGGCRQRRLCCPGRNLTCFDYVDEEDRRRNGPDSRFQTTFVDNRPNDRLVLPNDGADQEKTDSAEFQASDTETSYHFYNIPIPVSPAPRLRTLIFGDAFYSNLKNMPEYQRFAGQHRLIRYSLLNEHLPLKLGDYVDIMPTVKHNGSRRKLRHAARRKRLWKRKLAKMRRQLLKTFYALTKRCYCDEACVQLGDCCGDYASVCPLTDCQVSQWSSWSTCTPSDPMKLCGPGIRNRIRHVLSPKMYAGADCPPLEESFNCFRTCNEDETTVALLIDYRYNKTRQRHRDRILWNVPENVEKRHRLSYYCVHYILGWVNQNCIDTNITRYLYRGNTICTECQPEAQLHRKSLRCASDLNDGDRGFWKLIGPKSCYGIWTRTNRTDDCHCEQRFPYDKAYLLV